MTRWKWELCLAEGIYNVMWITTLQEPGDFYGVKGFALAGIKVSFCEKKNLQRQARNKHQNVLNDGPVSYPVTSGIYFMAYENFSICGFNLHTHFTLIPSIASSSAIKFSLFSTWPPSDNFQSFFFHLWIHTVMQLIRNCESVWSSKFLIPEN